jgi:glycerophosphoryl diester phosphodiesterase
MQQLLPRLFARPLLFAHRGGRSPHPENSLAAFNHALEHGVTALETDLWATADDVVVLDHDGVLKTGFRRRPLRKSFWQDASSKLTSLEHLLASMPVTIDLSVDVKDDVAFELLPPLFSLVERDPQQLWICHPDLEVLAAWVTRFAGPRYVHSTKLTSIETSPERHAQQLRSLGVSVCNMHWRDWSGGLVALYHRFEIGCFAWGLEHETEMQTVLRMGMDGLYADDIDLLESVYQTTC